MVEKLPKYFYGLWQIIKCIDDTSFELDFTWGSKIHHIFHASKLKPLCKNDKEL